MDNVTFKIDDPCFAPENFDFEDLQGEIRVDELARRFLKLFHSSLLDEGTLPEEAGSLAHGADYFLRDFVIADRRENIFHLSPGRVRQFAGNWYITKTVEPNMKELDMILDGVQAFYRFASNAKKVKPDVSKAIAEEASKRGYYRSRIEAFWSIEGDGYIAWERECSLKG